MRSRHLYRMSLICAAGMLFPGIGKAQNPWTVTIGAGLTSLRSSTCTPVTLSITDPATATRARNGLGALVTIADFDMTVTSTGGAVVGRYAGAGAWAACGCPASTGAVAIVTATYPAKSLPAASRVPNVPSTSTKIFPVVAGTSTITPIGRETTRTITRPIGVAAPWTTTLTANLNPLPVGLCTPILIDLRDATGKEEPRNPAGMRVTIADFYVDVTGGGASIVALNNYGAWSVCACQGATVGAPATVTASYPAKLLAQAARVPGVVFQSSIEIQIATAKTTSNPAACTPKSTASAAPAAPTPVAPIAPQQIAVAPLTPKTPITAPTEGSPIPVAVSPVAKTPIGPLAEGPPPRNVQAGGNPAEATVTWYAPWGSPGPVSYVVERWNRGPAMLSRIVTRHSFQSNAVEGPRDVDRAVDLSGHCDLCGRSSRVRIHTVQLS